MSQNEMVLGYLENNGSITQADAIREFGCYRLGARIYDLKKRGHKITRVMESTLNRYGVPVSFARYRLKKEQTA